MYHNELLRLLHVLKEIVTKVEAVEERLEVMQCQLIEIANEVDSFQQSSSA